MVSVPALCGWGPCGLGGGVGRFSGTLGGVLECCSLFSVAGVWCGLFWLGLLVVRVRWFVGDRWCLAH